MHHEVETIFRDAGASDEEIAQDAYRLADAMLRERGK